MHETQEWVQQFFLQNPDLLQPTVPHEEVVSRIEGLVRHAREEEMAKQARLAAIRTEGAAVFHAIFNENSVNEMDRQTLFALYHMRIAVAEATKPKSRKSGVVTEEPAPLRAKNIHETNQQLTDIVIDGTTFVEARGIIYRLKTAAGDATGVEVPTAPVRAAATKTSTTKRSSSSSSEGLMSAIVAYLKKHPGTNGEALRSAVDAEKPAYLKAMKKLKEEGKIKQEGDKRGAKYSVK